MSECEYYQEQISRKLDEVLSPEEEAALADHLRSCPDCAALADAFAALSRSLSGELEEPPEELCVNIMAQIHRVELRKRNRRRIGLRLLVPAAACAALLLAGSFYLRPMLSRDHAAAIPAKASLAGGTVMDLALPEAAPAEAPAAMAEPETADMGIAMNQSVTAEEAMPVTEAGFDGAVRFSAMMRLPRGHNRPPLAWEELDALLAGVPAEDAAAPIEEPVLVLTVSREGVNQDVAFYGQEGALCYADPADGLWKESTCSLQQLQALSEN